MLTAVWHRFEQAMLEKIERDEGPNVAADPSSRGTHGADRLHELDGIRGWAALAVVVFHVFYECLGALFPAFRNPLTKTFNGSFAVYVFFVLSGDALSTSYFTGAGMRAVASLAVKRHSRLSIPIFGSIAALWALQRLGLVFSAAAASIVHRPDWLGHFATTPISLADCVKYALMNVYLTADADRQLIPFLWTMSAEMVGSIFVFAVLGCWAALRRPALFVGASLLILLSFNGTAFLAAFAAGLLFSSARARGLLERVRRLRLAQPISALVILLALVTVWRLPLFDARDHAAAAIVLVGAIFVSRPTTAFFRAGPSRLLGRLSFPLYLIHLAVIVSLTSGLVVWAARRGQLDHGTATWIGLASVAAALIAAAAFEPIEFVTKRVGHWLSAIFVAPRLAPPRNPARGAASENPRDHSESECTT